MEFQHVASSTFRVRDSLTLTLYGRMVSGQSIAVHVRNLLHYGFLQCDTWSSIDSTVFKYVKAWCCYQKAKKYGIGDPDPMSEHYVPDDKRKGAFWKLGRAYSFSSGLVSGFNIRHVEEGAEKTFVRFETRSPTVWRALCQVLTKPMETRDEICQWALGEDLDIELPPAFQPFMLYETFFKPETQFMVDNQLISCGWMYVEGPGCEKRTTCDVEINARIIRNIDPPQDLAPIRVLSYDIEAQPHVYPDGREPGFPEPEHDPILTIGVTWFTLLDTTARQAVFQLEPSGIPPLRSLARLPEEKRTDEFDPSTTEVFSYTDEHDLLQGFADYVTKYDPDIITGYNILAFDNPYLIKRAAALNFQSRKIRDTLYVSYNLGRVKNSRTSLRKIFRSSNQTGGSESFKTSLEGRTWTDLFKVIMSDHKLRSYKMDSVAEEFLGTRKIHIAYGDIPTMQQTKEGRHTLATYCVKDSWIPCQLGIKRSKFINAISMSRVTNVSMDSVLHRGQQIRTITLMLTTVRARERAGAQRWFIPDESTIKQPQGSFTGAVVISPIPGFYEQPVVTLDFASLYPSIMRAYNMCFSTLITTPAEARERGLHFSDDDPAPTFRPVREFESGEIHRETKENPFRYVEKPHDTCFVTSDVRVGILPEILEQLLSKRKQTKKLMKKTPEESVKYAVLDGYQLALKVCANSVYGFTGASSGFLPEKRIASAVTRAGRGMTNQAKFKCEYHYREHGLKVVYGDSVIGNTPLLLRINGDIVVRRIESLADVWGNYHGGKESAELTNIETWTESGWTRVQRVIRHRLTKSLVRVQTHTGHVVCTTDHSLIRENGEEVAPRELKEGDTLMHHSLAGDIPDAAEQFHTLRPFMNRVEDTLLAARICVLMQVLHIPYTVEYIEDGVFCIREHGQKNPTRVQSITPYTAHEEYVYDLTTDNHHFQAGVGSMIVHNTDSIFVHLPPSLCPPGSIEEVSERAAALGAEMSELCNSMFLKPNDLEYEKFYYPLLLKGKKRYCGFKVEPGKKSKLDAKGFECVRRDFAPIVSKTQKTVFKKLIEERDTRGAVEYARSRVEDLMNGRCDIEELVLSKQLTQLPDDYKSNAAHVELAKRLIRDLPPTVAPKVGDRIDYIIRTGEEKQYLRAVTPDEIRSGQYTIDTQYYLDKQLRKPLFRVFDMVVANPDDIFKVRALKRQIPKSSPFAQYVTEREPRKEKRKRANIMTQAPKKKKTTSIMAFFK